MTIYTDIRYINLPKIDDIQYYIYVIENTDGLIKIGRTKDILQRAYSLSGSNGGGHYINRIAVSPTTYLRTLEGTLHSMYNKYRLTGTEWFKDITFEEVVNKIDELFNSDQYKLCNELRKQAGGYSNNNK